MREWERCHWARKAILQTLGYSAALITFLYALREPLLRALRALFGVQS